MIILETSILSKPSTRSILLINFYYKTKRIRCDFAITTSSNASLICTSSTRTYI
nr:MAG TPA_asm: hypothetical protein [Caudoviricetes sp.]